MKNPSFNSLVWGSLRLAPINIIQPSKIDTASLVACCLGPHIILAVTRAMHSMGEKQHIPGWQYYPGLQFFVARILPRVQPVLSCPSTCFHVYLVYIP